ncbi:MAG: crotonase/enoyl-CoA hydratase family protein [Gammaproteobacteria bacterium]|nr:crotonase/enoyl-CoA hydratase family protein [Gammaproteobacteria bacterium]
MATELDISTDNCIVEKDGKVLIVTLNRPEAKNAFSPEMLLGMYKAWRLLDDDDDLLCAILTANGDTFCAGMDLKAGAEGHRSTEEFMTLMGEVPNIHWQALLRDNLPKKPLILAVEGYALAGGTEILAGTDIRVAAEDATFGVTEVARGLYPMAGSSIRLPRQIPYCLAAEIVLLGRHISAQEALDWGLINRLVPKGEALNEAKKIAAQIAETGPIALKAITRSLRELQCDIAEEEAMLKSDELAGPVFASKDAKEGMRAFKEKRKAVFTGE